MSQVFVFFYLHQFVCKNIPFDNVIGADRGKIASLQIEGFFFVAMVSYKVKLHSQWLYKNFFFNLSFSTVL